MGAMSYLTTTQLHLPVQLNYTVAIPKSNWIIINTSHCTKVKNSRDLHEHTLHYWQIGRKCKDSSEASRNITTVLITSRLRCQVEIHVFLSNWPQFTFAPPFHLIQISLKWLLKSSMGLNKRNWSCPHHWRQRGLLRTVALHSSLVLRKIKDDGLKAAAPPV